MARPPLLLLLLAAQLPAAPAMTQLTLVNEPGFNVLQITVSGQYLSTSHTQSVLTGTVDAWLDVDHGNATTSELTLLNGQIAGSDFSASGTASSFGIPLGTYQLNATGLAGTFFTIQPPGAVTPSTGTFNAAQHRFVINQGNVSGNALGQTYQTAFNSQNPFAGTGSGSGSVTLTPAGSDADSIFYQVVVVVPGVSVTDSMVVGNPPLTSTVTVTGTGTIKAAGLIDVPRSAYRAWTLREGIPGAAFSGDANADGMSNGMAWAMGLGAQAPAGPVMPRATQSSPPEFEIPFPSGGSKAPIWIEVADTPGAWSTLPPEDCSLGVNPLPTGTTGIVRVVATSAARRFLRLRTEE